MNQLEQRSHFQLAETATWPVLVCVLGNFRLLKSGAPIAVYNSGKLESLLGYLGLHAGRRVPREHLLALLWPGSSASQAGPALNNLIYRLHKMLGDALDDTAPVVYEDGYYRLNSEAGVGVDLACFDALVDAGARQRDTDAAGAIGAFDEALRLYRGDLCIASDVQAIVERERLRNRFLSVLAELADYHYHAGLFTTSLEYGWRLLREDPCREDAHRLIMRCYVHLGQRATALHHYQVCTDILRAEFGAIPEAATTELFHCIRLQPTRM